MPDQTDMMREAALFWLRWQAEMGADEAIASDPLNRLAPAPPKAMPRPAPRQAATARLRFSFVIPVKAGISSCKRMRLRHETPAFAGVTRHSLRQV